MMTPKEFREAILAKLPPGAVETAHTDAGHFYRVPGIDRTFSSVTAKLQILKDEGLINYKMNRALEYVERHWSKFNNLNVIAHLERAKNVSADILKDAGDVGTMIHDCRERFFEEWAKSGQRPPDVKAFIPEGCTDQRVVSGMRALARFCDETGYQPVISELYLYDEQFKLGGALDDIGVMDGKLVLLDVKTSNQFKGHYFFQVALYYMMFSRLTGLRPKTIFILKLSKEDGTYKIEELRNISKLVTYAKHMLKTHEALGFIEAMRKDNQKTVVRL